MSDIVLDNVTKRFGAFTAVDALATSFRSGEVTCLLGPSGCGKTTLMRMIAGLETPTEGRIVIRGRDVTDLPPRRRDVGMVFQYPVMYPTLTVEENIEEPLRHDRRLTREDRRARVDEMLDVLDMRTLAKAMIDELDAGERQKVAVGRAVARHASVVLFDEPTTNVEVNAKLALIRAFKAVTRRLSQTIIYVTHDQTEAMTLADRIALMSEGRIVQLGRPRDLYAEPETRFAGWFLGNPGMNYLPATIANGALVTPILAAPLPLGIGAPAGELVLGIRPEALRVAAAPGEGSVAGTVVDRAIGIAGLALSKVRLGDATVVKVKGRDRALLAPGRAVHLTAAPRDLALFAAGNRVPLSL
jgi:ABC-type sugar transport system ATPase subunit